MNLRLLYMGFHWVAVSDGPQPQPVLGGNFLDQTYLPIYVAHTAWALYNGYLYHRIYRHLVRSPRVRMLHRFTVLNMATCVVAAMIVPYVWVLSIAWGGFVVGLSLISVARLNPPRSLARAVIRKAAIITIVNTAFLGLVGGATIVASIKLVHTRIDTIYWTLASVFGALVLTYGCYAITSFHTMRPAVAKLLGLLARSSPQAIPSSDL